jgi:hypothetical protein
MNLHHRTKNAGVHTILTQGLLHALDKQFIERLRHFRPGGKRKAGTVSSLCIGVEGELGDHEDIPPDILQ